MNINYYLLVIGGLRWSPDRVRHPSIDCSPLFVRVVIVDCRVVEYIKRRQESVEDGAAAVQNLVRLFVGGIAHVACDEELKIVMRQSSSSSNTGHWILS